MVNLNGIKAVLYNAEDEGYSNITLNNDKEIIDLLGCTTFKYVKLEDGITVLYGLDTKQEIETEIRKSKLTKIRGNIIIIGGIDKNDNAISYIRDIEDITNYIIGITTL